MQNKSISRISSLELVNLRKKGSAFIFFTSGVEKTQFNRYEVKACSKAKDFELIDRSTGQLLSRTTFKKGALAVIGHIARAKGSNTVLFSKSPI